MYLFLQIWMTLRLYRFGERWLAIHFANVHLYDFLVTWRASYEHVLQILYFYKCRGSTFTFIFFSGHRQ